MEFSNHGAVVKSWQLKKYLDDSKPQRVLDVVHPDAAKETDGWPFALVLDESIHSGLEVVVLYNRCFQARLGARVIGGLIHICDHRNIVG